jgi:hypothetical protein
MLPVKDGLKVPIDILLNIALYTKFKQTIVIMGCCRELFSYRKILYNQKQLLKHTEVIDLWTPEKDYYASTTKFMIARLDNEYKFYTAFYELSNNIEKFLINNNYEIFNVTLTKPLVCISRRNNMVILRYYDSFADIELDKNRDAIGAESPSPTGTIINLKKSHPCWARWKSDSFIARAIKNDI